MRIAYLECFSGISGDMFMGALVDAGVPARVLEETVAALGVGARLEVSRVVRAGIAATKVDVWVDGEKDLPREEFWEHLHGHSQAHEHSHSHEHDHSHSHTHVEVLDRGGEKQVPHPAFGQVRNDRELGSGNLSVPGESERAGVAAPHKHGLHEHSVHSHRGLKEIREIISGAAISESAKKKAIAIFEKLGAAEAKIHNTSIDEIHFHEVGAVDAIVDIVCAAVGAEVLGVDEIVCSSLNVGGGTAKCAHGSIPVPAPATVELLKDAPLYS